ncbi:nucleotidyltransferase family protein [Emticicia fontis]
MLEEKIEKSVAFLAGDLAKLQDSFYIIGSSALVLAGIPLEATDDVDLLTSYKDADFLKKHWKANQVGEYSPKDSDRFRSNFGRFQWDTVLVEVMGDLEVFDTNGWGKLEIKDYFEINVNQLSIRIPTLLEQERIFRLFGRPKDLAKADIITTHIKFNPKNGN